MPPSNGVQSPVETAPTPKPRRRGRPMTRTIKLDATPEEVARAMFAAVKPPDPSRRVRRAGTG